MNFEDIFHINSPYVLEMYEEYLKNPDNVSETWQRYFKAYADGFKAGGSHLSPVSEVISSSHSSHDKVLDRLSKDYEKYGYLIANTNPLNQEMPFFPGILYQKVPQSFSEDIDISLLSTDPKIRSHEENLYNTYCGTVGVEINHLSSQKEISWWKNQFKLITEKPSKETEKGLFKELIYADQLEKFLGNRFIGKKRFSIEGVESQLCAVESYLDAVANLGYQEVYIGMAHRGRLVMLTGAAKKPLAELFQEFQGISHMGDVKYHGGYSSQRKTRSGKDIFVSLAYNPSHLEAVNPVVLGQTRARQESSSKALPILIHGDAAFAGQGIVYETLQMMNLKGYSVKGTLHIIANNQVGFTTDPTDSRSTQDCTDLAKGFDCPIFHVNSLDVLALHQVMSLCAQYRHTFQKDIFINLIGFRRHGHNETDEPTYTQPLLYKKIKTLSSTFEDFFVKQKISVEEKDALIQEVKAEFQKAFDQTSTYTKPQKTLGSLHKIVPSLNQDSLKTLGLQIASLPQGFSINPKLSKLLIDDRKAMAENTKPLDWGMAELLSYASLLSEGIPLRLAGQDAERGTFSHRHVLWVDTEIGQKYCPLNSLNIPNKTPAPAHIVDSFLSEYAALGFEYGFSTQNDGLTLWEAQFGDFANGAQIIIDQFIASGELKWEQTSNLIMLLPHGYEGQGPEHSSARMERFLQLCGNNNLKVASYSSVAQLFHGIRRHALQGEKKPMILFTPKSYLRHPSIVMTLEEVLKNPFQCTISDPRDLDLNKIETLILSTGKMSLECLDLLTKESLKSIALLRVEELYPFPGKEISSYIQKLPQLKKLIWLQEEPKNMGAYQFIRDQIDSIPLKLRLDYIGRSASASPATGLEKQHQKEQQEIFAQIIECESSVKKTSAKN